MTFSRSAGACALVASALLAACGGSNSPVQTAPAPSPAPQPLELTILHIDDHHSHLAAGSRTLQLETAPGTRGRVNVDSAGFPRVTAAIRELAAQSANVLKLHAGDALTGSLYFNRAGTTGEADAALMNTVCFDAFVLGNHEFDKGDSGLKGFIDLLHKDGCKTPVLSANVRFARTSALADAHADGTVNRSIVVQRGGQDIGLVGLTIAGKTKASSSPDRDTTFEDETVAAQREIDVLRARGVNKIVLMTHIGYDYDKTVVARLSGVDVVVGGDSHTLLGPDALDSVGLGIPSGPYPAVLRDRDGKQVCLVHAWEFGQVVGELKVSFDARGEVTACRGTPHVLIGDNFTVGSIGTPATEAQKAAIRADIARSGVLRITAPDAAAAAVLAPFAAKVAAFGVTPVAGVPAELCARRVPGGRGTIDFHRSSAHCNALGDSAGVSLHGGDIQQMVAQSYLEMALLAYGGADMSLQGGGGARVPLKGTVTAADVISVLPFGNMLWRLRLTGAEVRDMLEDALDAVYTSGTTGSYPYTGGLRFDVDATRPKGARAGNLEVYDTAAARWAPIDPARSYRLVLPSYNAAGGDGYTSLGNLPAARREDIGMLDADLFQTWIERQPRDPSGGLPVLRKLDDSLYSTQRYTPP